MPKSKTHQDAQFATREDVREIVIEATDAILQGMEVMFKNVPTKGEFNELKNEVSEIKSDIHFIKDDLKNMETEISVLPRRPELDKLKTQLGLS